MILTLQSNKLTRYGIRDGYSFNEEVEQTEELSALLTSLLEWLGSNLATGESFIDVVLEIAGTTPSGFTEPDENGLQEPTGYRNIISAAVSVKAIAGSRTFVLTSEQLPEELRDALLSAWDSLK
jgi:pyrroline-5-carboxylate reductase